MAGATICDNAGTMDRDLTPLGRLLEAARQAKRPKLSQNAVAKAAGTSSTTYRRIISGISRFGGQDVPFDGSAATVAQIARALDVTPEQLEEVDRADAAEELRLLASSEQRVPVGQAVETDTAGPAVQIHDARLTVPNPPAEDEDEDPKMRRAMELMAEAQALLAEIQRERREGA